MTSLSWEDMSSETTPCGSRDTCHTTTTTPTNTAHTPCAQCLAMVRQVEDHYRDVTLRLLREMHRLEAARSRTHGQSASVHERRTSRREDSSYSSECWSERQALAELRATRRSIEQECASLPRAQRPKRSSSSSSSRSNRSKKDKGSTYTSHSPSPRHRQTCKTTQIPKQSAASAALRCSPTGTDPTRVSLEPLFHETTYAAPKDLWASTEEEEEEEAKAHAAAAASKAVTEREEQEEDSRLALLERQLRTVHAEMAELRSVTAQALQQVCHTVHELALRQETMPHGVLS